MAFFLIVPAFLVLCVLVIVNRRLQATFIGHTLLYLDIFVCSLLLSDPDMTISARCGLAIRNGRGRFLIGLGRSLNLLQPGHTELAIEHDIQRARRALSYLTGTEPVAALYDD